MKKNNLKRISSRILFWGVLFLSNLSLISIGFSAWSIVGAASAETQIQVSAADINEFVSNDSSINNTFFKIGNNGFIQDGMFCDKAYVIYNLAIFANKYSKCDNATDKAAIRFELKETNSTAYLINTDFLSATFSFDTQHQGKFDNLGQANISDGKCIGSLELSGLSKTENYPFSIRFEFNKTDTNKYTSLLNSLNDSTNLDFEFRVWGEAK